MGEIYKSVMLNIDDEINAVLCYIDENTARPFREKQIESGDAKLISKTKHVVKLSKTCILISQKSKLYTADKLFRDVTKVRDMIKLGQRTHIKKALEAKYEKPRKLDKKDVINYTDIKIFYKSGGRYLDSFKLIEVKRRECDVSLLPLANQKIGRKLEFDDTEDSEDSEEEKAEDQSEADNSDCEDDVTDTEAEEVKDERSKRCRSVPSTPDTMSSRPRDFERITVTKQKLKRSRRKQIDCPTDDEF